VLNACAACEAPDAHRTCGSCWSCSGVSMVRYCDRECQNRHWRRHKPDCGGRKACECLTCVSDRGESGA